jgi:hypothetical protein
MTGDREDSVMVDPSLRGGDKSNLGGVISMGGGTIPTGAD